ncbi:MAG: hypothetical protein AAGU10_08490 [Methanosarcina mazei]
MVSKYSDFITLNSNFRPVYSLETKDDNLWSRFVFTSDFGKLVRNLSPIFQNDPNKKQGYILTGTYGVGKTHATSVLSHLLWDDFEKVESKLNEAKKEMGEIGHSFYYFREKSRLFPVILTQKNSINANTTKNFELELQFALEKSLELHGLRESITQKTDFEKYISWISESLSNPSRYVWIEYMNKNIPKSSYFDDVQDLLKGLENRDKKALETVSELFNSLDLTPPQHTNTVEYYRRVFEELKRIDSKISGIMIYWDEFTTVFNHAGRFNDTTLIGAIQSWAELASDDIYLFLVSHRSPQQFSGKYKDLSQDLAFINDRFIISDIKLDKITAYHLIASSLEISEEDKWKQFLELKGFNLDKDYAHHSLQENFGNLFKDIEPKDEKYIKRTVPLHPYSLYTASILSDLVGSAERSIFELLYGDEFEENEWGTKIGFSRFLESEPESSTISWYTLDMIFDYFYSSISDDSGEYYNYPAVEKAINFFKRSNHLVKALGTEHIKVFKSLVLMESLHAVRSESGLVPSETNLRKAFQFTKIPDLDTILSDLIDNYLIMAIEDKKGERLYKTPYSGMDEQDIAKRLEKIKKSHPFKLFISSNKETIEDSIIKNSSLRDVCRIKNNHYNLAVLSSDSLKSKEEELKNIGSGSNLEIAIIIPENYQEIPKAHSLLTQLSQENNNAVFLLYDGDYQKSYERWLKAVATKEVGQEKQDTQMIDDSKDRIKTIVSDFTSDLSKVYIIFRGNVETKTEGLNREIKRCNEEIFYKGFDHREFHYFWKPRSAKDIFEQYGKSNAKNYLFNEMKNSIDKNMHIILCSNQGDSLVDENLELRRDDNVKTSVFYELVVSIRNYVNSIMGKKFSLRQMIQDLKLEKPPYGLCGWIESIVISYALASFYQESRLEVVNGNSTTSKECAPIVNAIDESIKKPEKDIYLRYGSREEIGLISNLVEIFNLDEEKKTLKEISFAIRERINSAKVPLWSIPYNYEGEKRKALITFIEKLDDLIKYIADEDNNYQKLVSDLNEIIFNLDLEYSPTIWDKLCEKNSLKEGFKSFVESNNRRLIIQYPNFDTLIENVVSIINEDPWLWDITQVIEVLNSLVVDKPPLPPQNLSLSFKEDHVLLTWNPSDNTGPLPTTYLIYRYNEDDIDIAKQIAEVNASSFSYLDKSISPGKKYKYAIKAKNSAGESSYSIMKKILILPLPPEINLIAKDKESYIELSWESPNNKYNILNFKVYRGIDSSKLEQIAILDGETNSYKDSSAEKNTKYYYSINATNDSGEGPKCSYISAFIKQYLKPPVGIKTFNAISTSEGIKLDWECLDSEYSLTEEYLIFRESDEGKQEVFSSQSERSFFDKSVQPGKTYKYWIKGRNSAGESKPTTKTEIKFLKEPPNLNFNVKGNSEKVSLEWEKVVESYDIVKYNIFRGESQDNIKFLDSKNHPSTLYEDHSIKVGKTYFYYIVAINSLNKEGERGKIESFTIPKPKISIDDINKWREDSKLIARSDMQLFFSTVKEIIEEIIDNDEVSKEFLNIVHSFVEDEKGEMYE